MKKRIAIVVLSLLIAGAAQAQTIYRCGPQGREYSQLPCKDARPIETDSRTPAQRAAAEQVAKDEARRAEALRRERHTREREAQPAAGFTTAPREESTAPKKKSANPKKKSVARR
jgi:hypothetical protein